MMTVEILPQYYTLSFNHIFLIGMIFKVFQLAHLYRRHSVLLTKKHFQPLNDMIMKRRISGVFAIAGISLFLLSGCVSSKKYKTSQASLAQARNDSAQLAQQVTTLNQNVQSEQQKNADLQASLTKTNSDYAAEQKSLESCQAYFTKQQAAATQLSQELKDKLTQAGYTDQDLQTMNNCVYINLDESSFFRTNSTMATPKGKQVLTSIADVMKTHDDMNVSVENGLTGTGENSMSSSGSASMDTHSSGDRTASSGTTTYTHRAHRHTYTKSAAAKTSDDQNSTTPGTAKTTTTNNGTVAVHKPMHHHRYSEEGGSMTYINKGLTSKQRSAWMLKTGRVNTVAKGLLQNGVQRVSVVYNNNTTTDQKNSIKVVIAPAMTDANAPKTASTSGAGGN